jgi:hypothetical protein
VLSAGSLSTATSESKRHSRSVDMFGPGRRSVCLSAAGFGAQQVLIGFKDGYFERDVILLDCLLACAVSNICRQLEEMVEDAMWRMTTAH